MTRTLVWFRDDLRVHDHEALTFAAEKAASGDGDGNASDSTGSGSGTGSGSSGDVVGVFILDEKSPGIRPLGGATRWWLHHALESLRHELKKLGVPLLVRAGDPAALVPELARDMGAERVTWTRRYGIGERRLDAAIKQSLPEAGVEVKSFPGHLLHEPWTIETGSGGPYKVFTPFFRALGQRDVPTPLPAPTPLAEYRSAVASLSGSGITIGEISDLNLLPTAPDWAGGLRRTWDATESGGHERLQEFIDERGDDYDDARDRPGTDGTSRMSPYLRFGQITPRQAWHAAAGIEDETSRRTFRSELGWREFCWHLLYHFPRLPLENLRPEFDDYPWRSRRQEPEAYRAWTAGRTGFPLVDAGMRELWETGHMHNRVRMSAASVLVKNLGIHWREGEEWFWDTLVDADQASNPANWQWVAGCGMDAAPFFRIFNPERQEKRFDPDGVYIDRWVPERHTKKYPAPVVDLKASREEALSLYQDLRR